MINHSLSSDLSPQALSLESADYGRLDMRVSLQWLQELVACTLPVDELAERLSVAGFEVEEIEDLAARAAGVVVGHVQSREPHPNADKLSVCTVAIGAGEPLQIVCGAKNVRAGIHVAVATVGVVPAGGGSHDQTG